MGIGVLLRLGVGGKVPGSRVAVGKSSAVGDGAEVVIEGNLEVGMGGGVSVVGTSTTTMQPARPSTKGRSNQGILERGITYTNAIIPNVRGLFYPFSNSRRP